MWHAEAATMSSQRGGSGIHMGFELNIEREDMKIGRTVHDRFGRSPGIPDITPHSAVLCVSEVSRMLFSSAKI